MPRGRLTQRDTRRTNGRHSCPLSRPSLLMSALQLQQAASSFHLSEVCIEPPERSKGEARSTQQEGV